MDETRIRTGLQAASERLKSAHQRAAHLSARLIELRRSFAMLVQIARLLDDSRIRMNADISAIRRSLAKLDLKIDSAR
jgi:hypothetical protein